MSQVLEFRPHTPETGLRPATVRQADPAAGTYTVIPEGGTTPLVVRAAMAGRAAPRQGDTVLLAEESWILGVIRSSGRPDQIEEPGGASASLEGNRLLLRDRGGNLLFEHDPETGRSVLYPESGDLEVTVPDGRMELRSGKMMRLSSDESIELDSDRIRVRTREADLSAETTRMFGRRLFSRIGRASMIFDSLETRADRIYTRTREAYTRVEELLHTHAGRFWTAVRDSLHIKSKRSSIRAEGRMRIDGSRIDLG